MTTKKAITRGQFVVNVPVVLFMGLGLFGTLWYAESIGVSQAWSILGFLISSLIAWLYWGLVAPKWLLWAYENVENKAALRHRAEQTGLIWPIGHFFEQTMILSASERHKLDTFEEALSEQNIFDVSPNNRTMIIYISAASFWAIAFILSIFLPGGLYIFVVNLLEDELVWKDILIGGGMMAIGLYGLFRRIPLADFPPFISFSQQFFNKEPQIEIYQEGISIKLERTGIIPWEKVVDYSVTYEKGTPKEFNLMYQLSEGKHRHLEIDLDNYSVEGTQLEGLLERYVYKREKEN